MPVVTRGRPKGAPRQVPSPDYVPAYGATWNLPRGVLADIEAECDRVDAALGYAHRGWRNERDA